MDENDLDYLIPEPFALYKVLLEEGFDRRLSAAILYVLHCLDEDDTEVPFDEIGKLVKKKCALNKVVADSVVESLDALYPGWNS